MLRSTRALIPLLIVCLLLTACGSANNEATNNQTPMFAQDVCPDILQASSTCLTPHALRVDYGIESLIQKGFTGKGQILIDITSFDAPTLQQDMKVFDQTFNLPPVDLQVISPLHVPEVDPEQHKNLWAHATVTEVQMLHAVAPGAKIIVLESPVGETKGSFGLPEFRKLLQYAIDHQLGNIVSLRWNVSEATLQDTQGQQELNNHREIPYVSTDKDSNKGPVVSAKGQGHREGGKTAPPIWAGIQAIANQMAGHPLGFINDGLYKLATSASYQRDFHDITQGNNTNARPGVKGYSAAPGWDPVTGLGTPNPEKLILDLIAALK